MYDKDDRQMGDHLREVNCNPEIHVRQRSINGRQQDLLHKIDIDRISKALTLQGTPFSPGNRVTIWKDEFYCVCCSQTLGTRQSSSGGKSRPTSPLSLKQEQQPLNGNGVSTITTPKQPLKQAQQQNQNQSAHRLSFADHQSPISFGESGSGTENNGKRVSHKSNGSILKSSLRQSSTMQPIMSPTANGKCAITVVEITLFPPPSPLPPPSDSAPVWYARVVAATCIFPVGKSVRSPISVTIATSEACEAHIK
ncbi:hypothetical protein ACTXT7_006649 [Hymenolepis weldensis]